MGMFDTMSNNLAERIIKKCPVCGKNVIGEDNEWQTKDFDCILSILDLEDIIRKDDGREHSHEMHGICSNCGKYISVIFDLADNHITVSTQNTNSSGALSDSDLRNDYLIELTRFKNNKIDKAFSDYGNVLLNRLSIDTSEVDIDNLDKYYIIPKNSSV